MAITSFVCSGLGLHSTSGSREAPLRHVLCQFGEKCRYRIEVKVFVLYWRQQDRKLRALALSSDTSAYDSVRRFFAHAHTVWHPDAVVRITGDVETWQ